MFQQLVDTWYDPLYRFALSLVRNNDEALDLTQQTFARWAEKGHGLRDTGKAKSWLFTVLYREFLSLRRLQVRESTTSDQELFARQPDERPGPPRSLDGQHALAALQEIDPVYRAPLVLFYLENHSYREIAEILDVPIGTVMSRLARGKAHLRHRLASVKADDSGNIIPLPAQQKARHG
jgi:RNA polymerase sigma-70 factor (ECF subfamily)